MKLIGRVILGVVVATASVAYVLHSQVPNTAPSLFSELLRSETGLKVHVTAGADAVDGTLASVNSDYVTVLTADRAEIQIPFTSISHTARAAASREVGITLR